MSSRILVLLAGIFSVLLLAHVAWSFVTATLLARYYDHRPPEIRKLDNTKATDWEPVLTAFWRANVDKRPSAPITAFVGSSMTYGYSWQSSVIFSKVYADLRPDRNVINLSVIGADIYGLEEYVLCPLLDTPKKPDALIIEIPLVNTVGKVRPGKRPSMRSCTGGTLRDGNYFEFLLARPRGLGWLSFAWDGEAYYKPEQEIQINKVPRGYFALEEDFRGIEAEFRRDLGLYLQKVAQLGHTVFVFVSPIYLPAVDEVGADRRAVERQIQVSLEVCRANPHLVCLDAMRFSEDRNLFYNLTHLNQRGHRVFGEWLVQQVSPKVLPNLH